MQLGLSSYACAWAIGVPGFPVSSPLDAVGLVRHAAELGLGLVQIADNLPLENATAAEIHALRDAARAAGVAIEIGARGIARAHVRRVLALCEFLASKVLRVVVDTATEHPGQEQVTATVKDLLPALEAAGVVLAIENHDRFPARTLASIVEEIGSRQVGVCLDTVNSLGAGEGAEHVVACLAPFTVNLHVKDFAIRRASHMMGFEVTGTPAGEGALNIPWLLEQLRTSGRDPNALLELWPSPEPSLDETVRKEAAWRQSSIRYLRTLIG